MRIGLLTALASSLCGVACAQNSGNGANDVTVTLRVANRTTQFRLGEIVPVELVFQTSALDRYQIWSVPMRQIVAEEYDRFSVEPEEGVAVDPRLVIFSYNGFAYKPVTLDASPVKVALTLNDWMAFRKPGHYRIAAETTRVLAGKPSTPLTLRSNEIEIDEVTPEPGWAESQVSRDSAMLDGQFPRIDPNQGARALRFLGTLEAAKALVQFHLFGPTGAQYELVKGLRESPYRQEIIAALEAAFATPDVRIAQPRQVRSTLDQLKFIASKRTQP